MTYKHLLLPLMLLLSGCKTDDDYTGTGKFSMLTGDFVELRVDSHRYGVSAVTDDAKTLLFDHPVECSWAERGDTLYRALLYYDLTDTDGRVIPQSVSPVTVLTPQVLPFDRPLKADPVEFRSWWVSADRRYLNVYLGIKSGTDPALPEDTRQVIGLIYTDRHPVIDGSESLRLTLYHDQKGVPTYYTRPFYFSVPLKSRAEGDTIELSVETFSGKQVRRLVL
ncbi:MAG: NigD-like C-terminal domain-containing protein [Prevotella sp.]|nr:NigD-like C-terminal domain-containing protein [Prevotella sp.]